MNKAFEIILAFTLEWEGGLTYDTGGLTKYGIDAKSHPNVDIPNLSLDEAKQMYYTEYWKPFEQLPPLAAMLAFDAAVNCGVEHAILWLQDSVGVEPDGIIGPVTIQAVEEAVKDDPRRFVHNFQAWRTKYYNDLDNTRYNKYKYGWFRRVHDLTYMIEYLSHLV